MDIFGRSGQKMITLLNGGSEALDEFGFELSENFARNSETFNDNLTKVGIEMIGSRCRSWTICCLVLLSCRKALLI